MRTVTMPLAGDAVEIRTVRRRIREVLEAEAWNERDVEAILLSASEMVNNAFSHGRPPFLVQATFDRDAVIEVRDGDRGRWPHLRATPPHEPGGKGLWIVQSLAADWTARATSEGKAVLARFERHTEDVDGKGSAAGRYGGAALTAADRSDRAPRGVCEL